MLLSIGINKCPGLILLFHLLLCQWFTVFCVTYNFNISMDFSGLVIKVSWIACVFLGQFDGFIKILWVFQGKCQHSSSWNSYFSAFYIQKKISNLIVNIQKINSVEILFAASLNHRINLWRMMLDFPFMNMEYLSNYCH